MHTKWGHMIIQLVSSNLIQFTSIHIQQLEFPVTAPGLQPVVQLQLFEVGLVGTIHLTCTQPTSTIGTPQIDKTTSTTPHLC